MRADHLDDAQNAALAEWLRKATPDDLHGCATSWNWDNGTDVLHYIVTRPECEQATALHVLWHGEPSYFAAKFAAEAEAAKSSSYDLAAYTLIFAIVQRWRAGVYRNDAIRYDPGVARFLMQDVARTAGHAELSIPETMVHPVGRRSATPSEQFDEGVPFSICGREPLPEKEKWSPEPGSMLEFVELIAKFLHRSDGRRS